MLALLLLLMASVSLAEDQLLSARHYGVLQGLPDQTAMDIVQDQNQQIWLSTSNGLAKFNGQSFEVIRNQPGDKNSVLGNSISSIEMVNQDMWLLVEEMGLSKYHAKEKQFEHMVSVTPNDQSHLLNSDIFAITSDLTGRLFVFQFNAGVSIKRADSDLLVHHTKENSDWLNSLMFFDAEVSEDNQLWAVTLDGMALHWDLNNDSKKWFQVVDDQRAGANGLYDVTIDSKGQVWASGYAGVYQFDEQTGQFIAVVSEQQISEFFGKHVSVRSSYHDDKGNLWLATLDGLLRFDNGQLNSITFMISSQKKLKHLYVNKVFEDHEHNLWILTMEQGVFVVGGQWQHQNIIPLKQDGDSIKAAAVIAKAHHDRLYLSHEFSPKIEVF